jgi:uncharacterized RDD family membrane protein YckC
VASLRCKNCGYDNPPRARFCANCGSNLAAAIDQAAPTVVPSTEPAPEIAAEYMGFWIRFGAAIIDGLVTSFITFILAFIGRAGSTALIMVPFLWLLVPWLYHWLFIGLKGQTLGKMAVGIKVINAQGSMPGLGEAALREVPGKIVSSIVIYLGFLWIIWDRQKQGWHDKIANTYVVRVESRR